MLKAIIVATGQVGQKVEPERDRRQQAKELLTENPTGQRQSPRWPPSARAIALSSSAAESAVHQHDHSQHRRRVRVLL
ncbi:MAG: hypothetical protein ACXW32_06700, partial [Limisphaerales bacterium]